MLSDQDVVRFQAEHHPLEGTAEFATNEDYCLYLIHMRAYLEAAARADDRIVLDVGCNSGYGTAVIAREARWTVGVDVSERAVAAALRTHTGRNLEFRVIDGRQLPFEDCSFDLVTSMQVIEHVDDVNAYLSEVSRVLSAHGVAMFTTPNALLRLDPGMKPWNPFHVREFSAEDLRQTLQPWFPSVTMAGLFGIDKLQEIELRRLRASRENARRRAAHALSRRWRLRAALKAVVERTLPPIIVRGLRQKTRRWTGTQEACASAAAADPAFIERYKATDFFYRPEGLDSALDLMAIGTRG